MKKQSNKPNTNLAVSAGRKNYTTPILQMFGAVKYLTTGGSGKHQENTGADPGVKKYS